MNKIKLFLFKNSAKRHNRRFPRKKSYISYNRAKKILILFESKQAEDINEIKNIIKALKKDKKEVLALGFSKTTEISMEESGFIKIYDNKSVSFLTKPKRNIINELKSLEFELLIDLSLQENLFLSYLALYANALMKISSKVELNYLFDFILNVSEDQEIKGLNSDLSKNQILFNKINFYLKSIQTMD